MSKVVYISCPMTVPQAVLDEAVKKISEFHTRSVHWVKGTPYNESDYRQIISEVDGFVIILPEVKWKIDFDKMTSGSRKELSHARACNKPIYLFYKSTDGYHLYATDLVIRKSITNASVIISISGIPSTKFNFEQQFDTNCESRAIDNMYAGSDVIPLEPEEVDFIRKYSNQRKLTRLAQTYSKPQLDRRLLLLL